MLRLLHRLFAFRFALGILCAVASLTTPAAPAQNPLLLRDAKAIVDVWPAISILHDPEGKLTIDGVLAAPEKFVAPQSSYATLGLRQKVVWLHAPVLVPASAGSAADPHAHWILDFDYTLLNRIDVFVGADGRVVQHAVLGNNQPNAQRPINGRSHAVRLDLEPGVTHVLFMRVETTGAMILPVTLSMFSAFHGHALAEQMLQGLLTSLGLCLLLYSLLQWASLRENLYIKYSLLVFGSVLFSVHFFGIGDQYLWTDNAWLEKHLAGISALIASCGTALFIEDVLAQDMGHRLRLATKSLAAALAVAALAHALDIIDIHGVSVVMSTLGIMPSLMGIPGAIARTRRGDSVGVYFLLAWIGYFAASIVMIGVVTGRIGVNFWTMHAFQLGATFDMLIFMRITALRSAALHMAAQRASAEHDTLHSLAHTDSLTKLLNRRGLNVTLTAALHNCTPEKLLAVYVLDLDGFKLVNDQFGHDVGDELLEIAASRLTATMRTGDGVARLGGDEFVVMAGGLQSDSQAIELGNKLVAAIAEPFALSQHTCSVGVTIGYMLAPTDGIQADTILKQADAAMYAGKQSGRNCLRRGVALAAR
jgi:diguanylate cyclase